VPSLEDTDRRIISVLEGEDPKRFTDIVESLRGEDTASAPKISRRLKHLVQIGMVRREVTEDWPPSARYYMPETLQKEVLEPANTVPAVENREPELKILLILISAVVITIGILQNALLAVISTLILIFIGYVAYSYLKKGEVQDRRLDMMDKRLERIEKRLFE